MKASVGGGILLLILVILVVINAGYIHSVTDDLSRRISALPETPDESTVNHIENFQKLLSQKYPLLRLSVSFSQLDRVSELSETLLGYAQSGAWADYRVTRALLLNAIEDMSRLERLRQ